MPSTHPGDLARPSPLSGNGNLSVGGCGTLLNRAAETLWYIPGRFSIARLLGPGYSLRCVLFHDVSDTESAFTKGLQVTITPSNFEAALKFITRHYTPVRLQDILAHSDGRGLPPRPVLITFDDAYASLAASAAPLCRKYGVPAVFFVNASLLDNRQLGLANLVCYVANTVGLGAVNAAIRAVSEMGPEVHSLAQVSSLFLPAISLLNREIFRNALIQSAGIEERDLAREANLYLTSQQLRDLAACDFEIGNHTYTHVNCRSLSRKDMGGEIDRNKTALEEITGTKVRSFSVPYGSSDDLTTELAAHLQRSGHEAVFLLESRARRLGAERFPVDRVSLNDGSDAAFFSQIEVLPRLRTIRYRLLGTSHLVFNQLSTVE